MLRAPLLGIVLSVVAIMPASAAVLDFSSFEHGEELLTASAGSIMAEFSVVNNNGPHHLAIFDTNRTGTSDDDLEGPPTTDWAGGNLAPDGPVGKILIIQENMTGYDPLNNDLVFDDPDDDLHGGQITLTFNTELVSFGFAHIDNEPSESSCTIEFYKGSAKIGEVNFMDFPIRDPSVVYGHHYANGIAPITAAELGDTFDTVVYNIDGSGGFGLVTVEVPEPGTLGLLIFGCVGVLRYRRRA